MASLAARLSSIFPGGALRHHLVVAARAVHAIPTLPELQRAQVIEEYGRPPVLRTDVPVQLPGANELLVNVKYSGVCHTDLHIQNGELPVRPPTPLIGGHEGAGVVVAVGDNVAHFKLGDYAGIKWINSSCMTCEMCHRGFTPNCEHSEISGLTRNGTFQEYAIVDAFEAAKIPKNVDLSQVAPLLCAGLTVYRGLKESRVVPGQIIAINGASGGLGSLAIQYAKAMGMQVIAIDLGADKEELCRNLGADFYIDGGKTPDIVEHVREISKGGAHGVLHIAPAVKPMEDACRYVRTRGTVVLISLPENAKISADVADTVLRAVTIRGSYVGNQQDADEAIDFFARGLIKCPIQLRGLSDLPEIYKDMMDHKIRGRVVVDISK